MCSWFGINRGLKPDRINGNSLIEFAGSLEDIFLEMNIFFFFINYDRDETNIELKYSNSYRIINDISFTS